MDGNKIVILWTAVVCKIATGCPTGYVSHGASCYHFSHDTETWVGAQQMCRNLEGQLVEINDVGESEFLKSTAKRLNNNFWIGLSDVRQEGTWMWMTSQTTLTWTGFRDWGPGEPNNLHSNENCVSIFHGGSVYWQWNDTPCQDNYHYICEDSNANILKNFRSCNILPTTSTFSIEKQQRLAEVF